ncbi:hypothetical protein FA13DRAFT_1790968 [Coprinellus micaceus]|uniref:Uncharacterized protein n=1 Tax=Coprinellus micaceus TaxID=71717 RepID=A0A4Y7TEZ2_COPMI|nr:hypothetical protein FA13DRAFT_1790968 [Coprinellus micaceus]
MSPLEPGSETPSFSGLPPGFFSSSPQRSAPQPRRMRQTIILNRALQQSHEGFRALPRGLGTRRPLILLLHSACALASYRQNFDLPADTLPCAAGLESGYPPFPKTTETQAPLIVVSIPLLQKVATAVQPLDLVESTQDLDGPTLQEPI